MVAKKGKSMKLFLVLKIHFFHIHSIHETTHRKLEQGSIKLVKNTENKPTDKLK
jgi:hypothetical protein